MFAAFVVGISCSAQKANDDADTGAVNTGDPGGTASLSTAPPGTQPSQVPSVGDTSNGSSSSAATTRASEQASQSASSSATDAAGTAAAESTVLAAGGSPQGVGGMTAASTEGSVSAPGGAGGDAPLVNGAGGSSDEVNPITSAPTADAGAPNTSAECGTFSFFVTSQIGLFALANAFNGSEAGFGGDLTYGETGPGAGLRGADKICTQIAAASCAGNGKTWRAFVSVGDDGTGQVVNAIDRIGPGPWYDRNGRLLGTTVADLLADRPNADAAIADDLPNENGFGNHRPDGTEESLIDNHNVMTGSDEAGHYAVPDEHSTTCNDWTDATLGPDDEAVGPNIGESWWRVNEARTGIIGWIDSGHNAAGCGVGAINPDEDFGFGVGEGDTNCGTVGCMGGYGGLYCFALAQ
jgi:hypothetical protein